MDTEALARFDTELETYAATSRPLLNSVRVVQHGEVISEHYWRGYTPTSYQHIFSVTKSVISALVGLALSDGKLTLSDTLAQWFPELGLTSDYHAASVTIRHLLTMTAGFQRLPEKTPASNRLSALVKRESASVAGEQFDYSNDDVDLLAMVLERAVGQSVAEYACQRLFAPLGIWHDVPKSGRKRLWKTDKYGHVRGAFGLHLTTPELARFGQFYLQNGKWEGEQFLPADYITASTTAQVAGGYPERLKYGYLWWISTDNSGNPAFFASGAGGQYVYMLPALELVTVITSTSKIEDGRHHRVMIIPLIHKYLTSEMLDR